MSTTAPDRVPCLTAGCRNTVQPATAARTGGYCGPCAGKRDAKARRAHVLANRRDVDRYAGVTDPVELLRLIHTRPTFDPLVNLLPPPVTAEALYLSLNGEDGRRLVAVAAGLVAANRDAARDIGRCLAAFTDRSLDPLLDELLDCGDPYPGLLFRGASGRIRDRLFRLLDDDTPVLLASHTLSALAWVGDGAVVRFLGEAAERGPVWTSKLHVSPADYAREGGWDLVAGRRRELTFEACCGLEAAAAGDGSVGPASVLRDRTDRCPWCGCELADLVVADLTGPPLDAIRGLGPRVSVVTCQHCTCYGPVHADVDENGDGRWSPANVRPTLLPADAGGHGRSPWSRVGVRLVPRRPTHAADWCLPTRLSQIGGHPAWVQHSAYPSCLRCGSTMSFVAQVDQAEFRGHEGIYYAFACGGCRTTATTYQQT